MSETFLEKWKHRFRNAWLVLTGRAWVGQGNPMHWQYVGPPETMTIEELERALPIRLRSLARVAAGLTAEAKERVTASSENVLRRLLRRMG